MLLVSLCETRWVERHDCILTVIELQEPIAAAFQQLDDSGASDSASRAHMLLLSASSSAFLIILHTAAKALALTLPLSKALQAVSIDLPSALSYVKEVNAALGQMRQNMEHEFKSIFDVATKAAEFFDTVIALPRRWGNMSTLNDRESFYLVQVCVPFLGLFEQPTEIRSIVFQLRPSFANPVAEDTLLDFYTEDVDRSQAIGELRLWRHKWQNDRSAPASALQAFDACDSPFYPNIRRILQILVTLPVTTADVERSSSPLRRLKTYLRATMSQARLVGLALLYSHREVTVDINKVIRRFALSSSRRLYFLL
ncbi:unnamed protein product [Ixodes persulcatus]